MEFVRTIEDDDEADALASSDGEVGCARVRPTVASFRVREAS